jgi:hypothetical protein
MMIGGAGMAAKAKRKEETTARESRQPAEKIM